MAVIIQPGSHSVPSNVQVLLDLSTAREWQVGLCGCCKDCAGCIYGCLCPACMSCDVSYSLNEWAWLPLCTEGLAIAQLRSKLRYTGRIHGSQCCDFMASGCFLPCALCQMHAEMKKMGIMQERGLCGGLFNCSSDKECRC